jgi:hypothetical protein
MKFKSILVLTLLTGCASTPSRRVLTTDELQKYQLDGIVHEVRICPNRFDDLTKSLKVEGECELVTCEQKINQIVCTATAEEKN